MPTKRLSTRQAAERLGVKAATLYAYVSRGLIASERDQDHGGSSFDPLEIEALARKRSGRSTAIAPLTGSPLMVLDSPFALLTEEGLYYRGRLASDLAQQYSFEQVASWLWSEDSDALIPTSPVRFSCSEPIIAAAKSANQYLGAETRATEHMLQALLILASHDPLKRDTSSQTLRALGGNAIAHMVEAIPDAGVQQRGSTASLNQSISLDRPIAERLWLKLTGREPAEHEAVLINIALVLLLDHDLATSTFAARVAASARAHPYAALISALAALDSSMHGSVSVAAKELITSVLAGESPERAISAQLSRGYGIPGFGHRIYRRRDPRAAMLLGALRPLPAYAAALNASAAITAVVRARTQSPVNIDLALAVFAIGAEMPDDGGQTIFAVARSAGWLAHIMDEYRQQPLRLRPIGQYAGPQPNDR